MQGFLARAEKIAQMLLTIFAFYLIFQIIRHILGGSWATEDIILGLLIFNLGALFTIGLVLVELKSDHSYLRGQFASLAEDFKQHVKKSR
ncbi:MAG: hypothetical protein ABIF10_06170 [Candidatus Woesearchaeota archaeon]